jgi:hypothetical protein
MKPKTVDKDATLRIQKVGGGTVELRGVFAGTVADELQERFLVNLDQPGHHVVGVFGGILKQTDQRSLPLDDPDKEKAAKAAAASIIANLGPAATDIAAISEVLKGATIQDVVYDADTGHYCVICIQMAGKKEKRFDLTFTNGTVTPIEPKKSEKEKPSKDATPGVAEAGTGEPMSEDAYAKLVDLAGCRANPHSYNNAIILCLLDVSNADNAAVEYGRNIDRWRYLAGMGADDVELLRHIQESLGGKKGRDQKVGDFTHRVGGGKKTTGIIFCIELADDKLPSWVPSGDHENIQSNDNNLVAGWRDLMHIPYPKAVK